MELKIIGVYCLIALLLMFCSFLIGFGLGDSNASSCYEQKLEEERKRNQLRWGGDYE